jgi:molybdate transport system regulatory protein
MKNASLWLRIDFADGRVGPGKIALLEAIQREGSISAAARALGMSYRRAWELVAELNKIFTAPVVERVTGGSGGGGARLTELGEALLVGFREIEAAASRAAAGHLRRLAKA